MQTSRIDAIVSAWQKEGEILSYSRIKRHLVEKGVIKKTNDRSLSRWLKNLVQEGILKKVLGGYALELKPKEYRVFDYLNELRQKYGDYIYEGEVGGFISHVCASTYLNFDETLLQEFDEKFALDIISIRLGELFWALYMLRNDVLKRRCGLTQLKLDDQVVREVLFGILTRNIGEHHPTEEIAKKHSRYLRPAEKRAIDNLLRKNEPESRIDYIHRLESSLFFDEIEEDPENYRRYLKKTASLDIEKYTVEELVDKFVETNEWIERNHKRELEEEHGYTLTQEESELEHNYRTAVLVKVAEAIRALGTNTEDFAVILTRHPATMGRYFTPEHILHEAVEWARSPPADEFLKKMWQEIQGEEKTFEAMVAERLSHYRSVNRKTLEKLKTRPWVTRDLSKLGSFDEILRIYDKKIKKRIREDEQMWLSFEKRFGLDELAQD